MDVYFEAVQRGLNIALEPISGFVAKEMSAAYGNTWWDKLLQAQGNNAYGLPKSGTYSELVDSMDISCCARTINSRMWTEVFSSKVSPRFRTLINELRDDRNVLAHKGGRTITQEMAERSLDTMVRLCSEIDEEAADELRQIYLSVRAMAQDGINVFAGAEQPSSVSESGAGAEGGLLHDVGSADVEKTTLSRKITFGGKTLTYPVYRVKLGRLYYNDQNDRIATWLSRYETEHGELSLSRLDRESYNRTVEEFICESNPDAIKKTQSNIALTGQREPGVVLSDGRIVDGNRRFTCLRRLQRKTDEPLCFETVIMDADFGRDRKQIKLLELAIQHGEEKKVDYDLIDYAVGTYRDIVQTGLLTVEEYAASTNEPMADVRKRLEIAGFINEFLDYIGLPGQYHIARDKQVFSVFQEMLPITKKFGEERRGELKRTVFNNIVLKAIPDQRKFIRDIKNLVKCETCEQYLDDTADIRREMGEKLRAASPDSEEALNAFAAGNEQAIKEFATLHEIALLRSRAAAIKSRPSENVKKCLELLTDIDPRLFFKLDGEEREELKAQLEELMNVSKNFTVQLERRGLDK